MERPIIEIDEEKCDGCGQCVLDCAEGALAVVNGKARLIRDSYCDGLGACLNCPRGALRIVMREAEAFDEAAALAAKAARDGQARPQGCPGSRPRTFAAPGNIAAAPALTPLFSAADNDIPDSLRARTPSWPIQLRLLPPQAPFLSGPTSCWPPSAPASSCPACIRTGCRAASPSSPAPSWTTTVTMPNVWPACSPCALPASPCCA